MSAFIQVLLLPKERYRLKLPYCFFAGYVFLAGCTAPDRAPDTAQANTPLIEIDELCGEDPICVSGKRLAAKPCLVDSNGQALRYASAQELLDARSTGRELAKCVAQPKPTATH